MTRKSLSKNKGINEGIDVMRNIMPFGPLLQKIANRIQELPPIKKEKLPHGRPPQKLTDAQILEFLDAYARVNGGKGKFLKEQALNLGMSSGTLRQYVYGITPKVRK